MDFSTEEEIELDFNINNKNETIFDTENVQNYTTIGKEPANSGKLDPLYVLFGS